MIYPVILGERFGARDDVQFFNGEIHIMLPQMSIDVHQVFSHV